MHHEEPSRIQMPWDAAPFLCAPLQGWSCTLRNIPGHQSQPGKCIPGGTSVAVPGQAGSGGGIQMALVASTSSWVGQGGEEDGKSSQWFGWTHFSACSYQGRRVFTHQLDDLCPECGIGDLNPHDRVGVSILGKGFQVSPLTFKGKTHTKKCSVSFTVIGPVPTQGQLLVSGDIFQKCS